MAPQQTYFEDVAEGQSLPSFQRVVNLQQLVRYAEASRDYARIHYDDGYARQGPWGSIILHGMLKSGFLAKVAGDLAGPSGVVRKASFQYRRPDFPGDVLTSGGTIVRKYDESEDHVAQCALWLSNGKGEVTTTGTALVALPAKEEARQPGWAPAPEVDPPAAGTEEAERAFPDVDRVRGKVGVPWKPWVAAVNAFWIKLFARALDDMNPLYVDEEFAAAGRYGSVIAPPTFAAALDPFYRPSERPPAARRSGPRPKGAGNGWDEFELFEPVRPGDVITSYGKWTELYEKPGRSGTLLFIPREVMYRNQHRRTVARSRGAIIHVI